MRSGNGEGVRYYNMVNRKVEFDLIAHRGLRSKAPENTLSAIRAAIVEPVRGVEFDVSLTKDGIPICVHQESLIADEAGVLRLASRAEGRSWVEVQEFEEIKKLDAGTWFSPDFRGEPVPSLGQVLALNWNGKEAWIELKDPFYWKGAYDLSHTSRMVGAVRELIEKFIMAGNKAVIITDSPPLLNAVMTALRGVDFALPLWSNWEGKQAELLQLLETFPTYPKILFPDLMAVPGTDWEGFAGKIRSEKLVFEVSPALHEGTKNPPTNSIMQKRVNNYRVFGVSAINSDHPLELAAHLSDPDI